MPLKNATNVSFEDENEGDAVDSKADSNGAANAVEAKLIKGHVDQEATDDACRNDLDILGSSVQHLGHRKHPAPPLIYNGFSVSSTNKRRILSHSVCAAAVLFSDGNVSRQDLEQLQQNAKEAKVNLQTLNDLEAKMNNGNNQAIRDLQFLGQVEGLSPLAQSLSSQLSATNKKFEAHINVQLELMLI